MREYASTPSYDNSATRLFTMRVYSLSLETRTLFQEVFKSRNMRCFPFSGDVFCVDKKVLADILQHGNRK